MPHPSTCAPSPGAAQQTATAMTPQFYCERHRCHMRYAACVRRQALAAGSAKTNNGITSSAKSCMIAPELCIDCPQGKKIAEAHAQQKASGLRPDRLTGRGTTCTWPGCNRQIHSSGLCAKHHKAATANRLIKLNTKGASADALRVLIEQFAQIANRHDMAPEDVALACLHQGIQVYFKRRKPDETEVSSEKPVVSYES